MAFSRTHRSRLDAHGGPIDGAFVVSHRTGKVLACGASIRERADVDQGSADGIGASMLAATLERGAAFTRSSGGTVTAFVAAKMRHGEALAVYPKVAAPEEEKHFGAALCRADLIDEGDEIVATEQAAEIEIEEKAWPLSRIQSCP